MTYEIKIKEVTENFKELVDELEFRECVLTEIEPNYFLVENVNNTCCRLILDYYRMWDRGNFIYRHILWGNDKDTWTKWGGGIPIEL